VHHGASVDGNIEAVNKLPSPRAPRVLRAYPALCCALALVLPAAGRAQTAAAAPLPAALAATVEQLAITAAATVWGETSPKPRTEVIVGALNPRLKLAPCEQIVPYLPTGTRPLGHTRIGLRCARGSSHWNVSLPVTVKLWAPSLVATTTLPAGTVLTSAHLKMAEVDLAERPDPAIMQDSLALGRTLARGLSAGDALRRADLKTRQYFSAGDTVRVVAVGPGYAISSEGQALGPGLEGQHARVRTENGRVLSGVATAERRIEVAL
jgi:flagella basal body P-ring formation protein FlgA